MKYKINIAFVCFKTKKFIEKNISLIKRLNKGSRLNIKFYICDNNEKKTYNYIKSREIEIFKGVKRNPNHRVPNTDHLNRALNKVLRKIKKPDFLIIIDPDFYIIEKNWIIKTIEFCNSNKISIFGAPWFPTHLSKPKYFPCSHYTVFKKNILSKNLDFTIKNNKNNKNNKKYKINKQYGMLINFLLGRNWIRINPDTGYKIYKKFVNSKINFESLTPIISKNDINEIMGYGIISYIIKFINYFKKSDQQLLPEKNKFIYEKNFSGKFYKGFQNFTFNKKTTHAIHLRGAIYRAKKNKYSLSYAKKVISKL